MSTFTPGPWRVQLVPGSYKRPALVLGGDKVVAQCVGDQLTPDATSIGEAEANAKLIAAAPDMLTEMKAAAGYLRNAMIDLETGATKATAVRTIGGGLVRLEAAIAKAEGQS